MIEKNYISEACVQNISEALAAEARGANRIELCENLTVGGITPSYGMIKTAQKHLKIPILVMIRPRGGGFVYSDFEIESMIEDIQICKELGVAGVVFGVLNSQNEIDFEVMKKLTTMASPLQITFHKAFDLIENWKTAVNQLIELKITRILTSGFKNTAEEGIDNLNYIIDYVQGKIQLVVAGKVTKQNLKFLQNKISAYEFHGKKIV